MIAEIDYARSAHLGDVGLPGYLVAVVTRGGIEDLVLVDESRLESGDGKYSLYDYPAHESTGRLYDRDMRYKLRTMGWVRCGRPRRDGKPCQSRVDREGDACHQHQECKQ